MLESSKIDEKNLIKFISQNFLAFIIIIVIKLCIFFKFDEKYIFGENGEKSYESLSFGYKMIEYIFSSAIWTNFAFAYFSIVIKE